MVMDSGSVAKLQYRCMVMRVNLDCNSCCRKARRIILNMKGIESHVIDKNECMVTVCGRFRPADVAIKLRKKMNRRVQILQIQDFDFDNQQYQDPPPALAS